MNDREPTQRLPGETAYQATLRAAAMATLLELGMQYHYCGKCRGVVGATRWRTELFQDLRALGHVPTFGPVMQDGRPTIELHCRVCPLIVRAHVGMAGRMALLRVDAVTGMASCPSRPEKGSRG